MQIEIVKQMLVETCNAWGWQEVEECKDALARKIRESQDLGRQMYQISSGGN